MPFWGDPTGKGGAGAGDRLRVVPMARGDQLVFSATYSFGFSASPRSHAVYVSDPLTPPVGPDPVTEAVPLVESATGEYDFTGAFGGYYMDAVERRDQPADGVLAAFDTGTWKEGPAATALLAINSASFPVEDAHYLIAVAENANAPGGPLALASLVDLMLVYVREHDLEVFDVAVGGVDTATLNAALWLAGHNLKSRNATFVQGLPATRQIVGFDRALHVGTTPSLEEPSSDVGLDPTLGQLATATPDELKNVQLDRTEDL